MNKNIEKLGLWDRFFNRYRKEILQRGEENFSNYFHGNRIPNSTHAREFVVYKIIDRMTGSETVEKEYLN